MKNLKTHKSQEQTAFGYKLYPVAQFEKHEIYIGQVIAEQKLFLICFKMLNQRLHLFQQTLTQAKLISV